MSTGAVTIASARRPHVPVETKPEWRNAHKPPPAGIDKTLVSSLCSPSMKPDQKAMSNVEKFMSNPGQGAPGFRDEFDPGARLLPLPKIKMVNSQVYSKKKKPIAAFVSGPDNLTLYLFIRGDRTQENDIYFTPNKETCVALAASLFVTKTVNPCNLHPWFSSIVSGVLNTHRVVSGMCRHRDATVCLASGNVVVCVAVPSAVATESMLNKLSFDKPMDDTSNEEADAHMQKWEDEVSSKFKHPPCRLFEVLHAATTRYEGPVEAVEAVEGDGIDSSVECADPPVDSPEKPVSKAEGKKPMPKEAKPAPKEAKPMPKEAKPAPEEAKPAPKEAKPAPKEAKPAPKEAKPAPEEAKPAPEEAKPAPKETKKRERDDDGWDEFIRLSKKEKKEKKEKAYSRSGQCKFIADTVGVSNRTEYSLDEKDQRELEEEDSEDDSEDDSDDGSDSEESSGKKNTKRKRQQRDSDEEDELDDSDEDSDDDEGDEEDEDEDEDDDEEDDATSSSEEGGVPVQRRRLIKGNGHVVGEDDETAGTKTKQTTLNFGTAASSDQQDDKPLRKAASREPPARKQRSLIAAQGNDMLQQVTNCAGIPLSMTENVSKLTTSLASGFDKYKSEKFTIDDSYVLIQDLISLNSLQCSINNAEISNEGRSKDAEITRNLAVTTTSAMLTLWPALKRLNEDMAKSAETLHKVEGAFNGVSEDMNSLASTLNED